MQNTCEAVYLLDAGSMWQSQQSLSQHCSTVIENYIASTPLKYMVLLIEPCQTRSNSKMKYFDFAAVKERIESDGDAAEDGNAVYLLTYDNSWETEEDFLCRFPPITTDSALAIPIEHCIVKAEVVEEKRMLPVTEVKQENVMESKAEVFCNTISKLLNNDAEKEQSCDHQLNESGSSKSKSMRKKNFTCKTFTQGDMLERDITRDIIETKKKCDDYGKHFKRKHSLKIHMGVKNYECAQCGKSFTQNGNLKTHMITHTGLKNYKCDQCGKQRLKVAI